MAAVTLLGSTFNTTTGTHTVTATPAVGDVIVIVAADSGYTGVGTPTDDNSSGVYTLVNSALKNTSADILAVFVRTVVVPAAVSTIFSHAAASSTGGGLAVYAINNGITKSGTTAILQSAVQANQSAGTPAPVFAAVPTSGNAIITAVFNGTNLGGVAARSSPVYTRDADLGYNTPPNGLDVAHIDTGETSATITWGGASASVYSSIAIEIDMRSANKLNNYMAVDANTSNAGIMSVTEKIR